MSNSQRIQFLNSVKLYIESDPEAAAYVSDFVSKGIEESRKQTLQRAADFEAALSVSLSPSFKNKHQFILSKILQWKDKSSLNWDGVIDKLKNKIKSI